MSRPKSNDPAVKISVSLPVSLRDWAAERASAFGMSLSEFMQHLIRTDRRFQPQELSIVAEEPSSTPPPTPPQKKISYRKAKGSDDKPSA